MALNNVNSQKYDYDGMAEGTILTSFNDIGIQKYDYDGMAQGGMGLSAGARLLAILGVGI